MRSACIVLGLLFSIPLVAVAQTAPPAAGLRYQIIKTFHVGGDGGWDYLLADPVRGGVYISRSDHVILINDDDGSIVGTIPDTAGVHGIALAPEFNRGFTSDGRAGTETVFDIHTSAILGKVSVSPSPDCIIYDPASKKIFSFDGRNQCANAVDASVDLKSQPVAQRLDLDGHPEFAAADDQGNVYVNLEDESQVLRIDSKALKITARWSLGDGQSPSGLAIDAKNRRLFSVCRNRKMIVMDADSGKIIASLPIGSGVDAAAFDPATNLAFASNGDGTLTVVHEDSPDQFSVVQNLPTKRGARTMALDGSSHRIFLATADFPPAATQPAGDRPRRPRPIPGTFMVLVVDY